MLLGLQQEYINAFEEEKHAPQSIIGEESLCPPGGRGNRSC